MARDGIFLAPPPLPSLSISGRRAPRIASVHVRVSGSTSQLKVRLVKRERERAGKRRLVVRQFSAESRALARLLRERSVHFLATILRRRVIDRPDSAANAPRDAIKVNETVYDRIPRFPAARRRRLGRLSTAKPVFSIYETRQTGRRVASPHANCSASVSRAQSRIRRYTAFLHF